MVTDHSQRIHVCGYMQNKIFLYLLIWLYKSTTKAARVSPLHNILQYVKEPVHPNSYFQLWLIRPLLMLYLHVALFT